MKIENVEDFSAAFLQEEVEKGGRFVYFAYTISLIIFTFRRTSGVHLIRANENGANAGFVYSLITALFGWWGIPWGPKYTISALQTNLHGGKDITDEVMAVVEGYVLYEESLHRQIA